MHANVDCHRLHVETVAGHTVSMSAKKFVAPGRTVAADNINLEVGISERGCQVVQQIKYPGIILMNFASAVVAQVMIQTRQGFRIVAFPIAVNDAQVLSRVSVEKS